MSPPRAARRPVCPDCLRAACVCACLRQPGVPVRVAVELLILQHPREQREAKGTARLLHQAVAGSRLLVGERWPERPPALRPGPPAHELLLYPPTPGDPALREPPALDRDCWSAPESIRLIVIDGTWRKSRRMLYDSPWLQSLSRLSLDDPPPSRYAPIRRARGVGQRSTFEAAVLALQQLEGGPGAGVALDALWAVFDGFVQGQRRPD